MSTTPADLTADRFPSLEALREAHTALLKASREEADGGRILKELRAFLARGVATGAVLDDNEERLGGRPRIGPAPRSSTFSPALIS
jgi:hypothetical protein